MNTTLHDAVEINRSRGNFPEVASTRRATRPSDLLPVPALDLLDPGTDEPADHVEAGRRAAGARCRIATGYLD
ncbi:hypothetical protein LN042_11690 [Kitasatospora sp. RB6PN24]|uniref:hypothetical protein n=1 Tax=Kitasatospora humi TaxID=2893891 RepID=UPI001E3FCD99|nr:hypothetical protein [Kitasatospora humi]MCC9307750.1 hypothetical protein [Kitasatospora humi]